METIAASWSTFKSWALTGKSLSFQEILGTDSVYNLLAFDGPVGITCRIKKDDAGSENEDQLDYQTNFQSLANKRLDPLRDPDGAFLNKAKAAPLGWTYQKRGVEFTTAKLSSLVNIDELDADLGDATLLFYEKIAGVYTLISGSNLTQPYLDSNCVRTAVTLEPSYEYYIIGGSAKMLDQPSGDVRISVVAVPDIPYAYGGSRVMVRNVNFKFIAAHDAIDSDGRTTKNLKPDATYHTNKLKFILTHPVGEQHTLCFNLEHFKF